MSPLMRSRLQYDTRVSSYQPGRWLLVLLCAVIFSFAIGCAGPKESANTSGSFPSGGLGLTLAEWEQRYNLSPIATPAPWRREIQYNENSYNITAISLWYDGSPNQNIKDALVYVIGMHPQRNDSEEELIKKAHTFLPADAEFQETIVSVFTEAGDNTIYRSRSLATRYTSLPSMPDPWKGRVPGTIHIIIGSGAIGISAALQEPPELHAPTETPLPPPTITPFILLPTPLPTEPGPPSPVPSQYAPLP